MPVSLSSITFNQSPIGPSTAGGSSIYPGTNTFTISGDFSSLVDVSRFKVEFSNLPSGSIDNTLNTIDPDQSDASWLVGTFVYKATQNGLLFVDSGNFTVTVTDPNDLDKAEIRPEYVSFYTIGRSLLPAG